MKSRQGSSEGGLHREEPTARSEFTAKLIVNEYGKDSREFRIAQRTVRVGRDPAADIVLDDVTVSRSHLVIHCGEGACFVEDLGSGNGTLLNHRLLPKGARARLGEGDRIDAGRSSLQFLGGAPEPGGSARRAVDSGTGDRSREERQEAREGDLCLLDFDDVEAFLLVEDAAGHVERHVLRRDRVRIGRRSTADVVLTDPSVSEHHAEIVYNREGFHIVDRDSSRGTFVDGVSVSLARLSHRAYLKFGRQRALFVMYKGREEPPEASFGLRDHLVDLYPDRRKKIKESFRLCREAGLDFAGELVERGVLNPEQWWAATRDYREKSASRRLLARPRRWLARILSRSD